MGSERGNTQTQTHQLCLPDSKGVLMERDVLMYTWFDKLFVQSDKLINISKQFENNVIYSSFILQSLVHL